MWRQGCHVSRSRLDYEHQLISIVDPVLPSCSSEVRSKMEIQCVYGLSERTSSGNFPVSTPIHTEVTMEEVEIPIFRARTEETMILARARQ